MRLVRLKIRWLGIITLLTIIAVVTGCGGVKADLTIFMSHPYSLSDESVSALEQELNDKLNGEYTIRVFASSIYNSQKIMLEYTAGNGLIVLPIQDIKKYSQNGTNLVLDDYIDPADYEEGVFEGINMKETEESNYEKMNGTFLFGIPTEKLSLMQKHGLVDKQWFVAVPGTTPDVELSIKVLKLLME